MEPRDATLQLNLDTPRQEAARTEEENYNIRLRDGVVIRYAPKMRQAQFSNISRNYFLLIRKRRLTAKVDRTRPELKREAKKNSPLCSLCPLCGRVRAPGSLPQKCLTANRSYPSPQRPQLPHASSLRPPSRWRLSAAEHLTSSSESAPQLLVWRAHHSSANKIPRKVKQQRPMRPKSSFSFS
jgi:hypothetical protein